MAKLGRRDFLRVVGAAATTAAASPRFLLGSDAYGQGATNRVLINIFGAGGFDGCTMFLDTSNGQFMDEFNRVRAGSIQAGPAGPNGIALGSTNYRMHGQFDYVASQFNAGKVALLGSVGVAQSNSGSHDIATDDWARGLSDGSFRGSASPFTQALAERFLANQANNVIRHAVFERVGDRTYVGPTGLSVNSLAGYGFSGGVSGGNGFLLGTAFSAVQQASVNPEQLAIQQAWTQAEQSVQAVAAAIANTTISPAFPNTGMGNSLRDIFIAIMNYEVRVAWARFGGNDRHGSLDRDGQNFANPSDQSAIWRELDDAIAALFANLERVGKAHLVSVAVMTEFGRTARINATNGTDHGKATNTFVIGGWINGGIYGAPPDLSDLQSSRNRIETKLPLGNVVADLINGLRINGATPISPTLFPWPHQTSIGISA